VQVVEAEAGDGDDSVLWLERGKWEERKGAYGSRQPKEVTTMVLDFRDIWIPHIRYREIEKSPISVRISRAAMNCQRAKRLLHIAVVVSNHGVAAWHRMATRKMEIRAQATVMDIVLHIAIEWPRPGVKRRKRKAVDSFVKKRVTIYRISEQ